LLERSLQSRSRFVLLGHIHIGTNVFHNIARLVQNRVSNPVDVLYRAIRQHDPVIYRKISFLADRLLDPFAESVAIIGVHQSKKLFRIWEVAFLRI
jgi:hypothetical protein